VARSLVGLSSCCTRQHYILLHILEVGRVATSQFGQGAYSLSGQFLLAFVYCRRSAPDYGVDFGVGAIIVDCVTVYAGEVFVVVFVLSWYSVHYLHCLNLVLIVEALGFICRLRLPVLLIGSMSPLILIQSCGTSSEWYLANVSGTNIPKSVQYIAACGFSFC